MNEKEVIEKLIFILDCYEGGRPLISNQGQALDGYSALAEFVALAKKTKRHLTIQMQPTQNNPHLNLTMG